MTKTAKVAATDKAAAEFAYSHLALTPDVIDKNTSYIRTASQNVANRAHSTAVAILIRSMPQAEGGHLDCSLALPLVKSMHEGMRRASLAKWFEKYSNIRITTSKDKAKNVTWKVSLIGPHMKDDQGNLMKDDKGNNIPNPAYKNVHPLAASAEPFWKLVAVEGPSELLHDTDFAKALASLVKRFAAEGKADLSEANKKRIESLKVMASAAVPKAANGNTAKGETMPIDKAKASVGSTKAAPREDRSFASAHA